MKSSVKAAPREERRQWEQPSAAEYWGDLISDCVAYQHDDFGESEIDGDERLEDLTGWLHYSNEGFHGGEGDHWYTTAPNYCLHVFADGSFMDCDRRTVLTFEQAVEEMGKILADEEVGDRLAVLPVLARVVMAACDKVHRLGDDSARK
jgi:hypothetical protein